TTPIGIAEFARSSARPKTNARPIGASTSITIDGRSRSRRLMKEPAIIAMLKTPPAIFANPPSLVRLPPRCGSEQPDRDGKQNGPAQRERKQRYQRRRPARVGCQQLVERVVRPRERRHVPADAQPRRCDHQRPEAATYQPEHREDRRVARHDLLL